MVKPHQSESDFACEIATKWVTQLAGTSQAKSLLLGVAGKLKIL